MAKTWKASPAADAHRSPTTITECAHRYHACAAALAKSFGLPMTAAFLQEYHSAISCVYIEASRCDLRVPAGVPLPPLTIEVSPTLVYKRALVSWLLRADL